MRTPLYTIKASRPARADLKTSIVSFKKLNTKSEGSRATYWNYVESIIVPEEQAQAKDTKKLWTFLKHRKSDSIIVPEERAQAKDTKKLWTFIKHRKKRQRY